MLIVGINRLNLTSEDGVERVRDTVLEVRATGRTAFEVARGDDRKSSLVLIHDSQHMRLLDLEDLDLAVSVDVALFKLGDDRGAHVDGAELGDS